MVMEEFRSLVLKCLWGISIEDTHSFVEKEGLPFLETSTLEATNVERIFQTIMVKIHTIISKKSLTSEEAVRAGIKEEKTIVDLDPKTNTKGCFFS